ncbi:UNVERIFIED_CONTAM: hypothetical protein PYX00_002632 [Menopon gallinae]|uniref:Mitochondrial 2-oxoglutarate/malate carrier protein n=1 Tax=Menopon gallinae TaxID=328185 RepID=A0AAW2HX93_9NEOP
MSAADTQIPSYVRFGIAGLAGGGASFVSHPFDLVKYRMQLSGKGGTERVHKTSLHAVYNVARSEGPLAIYTGLSASILRQLTLTMTRLGLYSVIVDRFTRSDGTPPSVSLQITAGLVSGFVGAVVGNPTDIALVRMSSDGRLPPSERYNYKHVFDAISRIIKEEGLVTLWMGWKPAALRCMVLNVTQIVFYKNTKVLLLRTEYFQDNVGLHMLSSVLSALVSAFATAPIDITKTRLMSMKTVGGKAEYSGMVDVWIKIIKLEGIHSLWKGVTPTFARILPNNLMIFLILETLTKAYKKVVLGDKSGRGF